jgi:hypothetical protein
LKNLYIAKKQARLANPVKARNFAAFQTARIFGQNFADQKYQIMRKTNEPISSVKKKLVLLARP